MRRMKQKEAELPFFQVLLPISPVGVGGSGEDFGRPKSEWVQGSRGGGRKSRHELARGGKANESRSRGRGLETPQEAEGTDA